MMTRRWGWLMGLVVGLVMVGAPVRLVGQEGSPGAVSVEAGRKTGEAYTLPPETLRKAVDYSRARTTLGFVDTGWGILQLLLLLTLGVVYRMRNVAVNVTRGMGRARKARWAQAGIFLFELMVVTTLLTLPVEMVGHHLAVAYGQSVQGWGSWFGDQAKGFGLSWVIGVPVVMLLFWVIRKAPRRWWLVFWFPAMGLVVLGIFASPYIIDPLFNHFEPLKASNPALVERLEEVVHRGGIVIPPERMFLMKASEKVTGLNAYVTGFGASKRVVVWDTSIAKGTPDEIAFIFGHEMGHYVLGHIPSTLVFVGGVLLVLFFVGFHLVRWLIGRYGQAWRVPNQSDWGALVVFMLVLSVLSFLAEPVINGYSRMHEHEADVYGQEAIHGIVKDPQGVAQAAFQLLGETSLVDPHPNAFVEFWTYSHPSIGSRAEFARDYDPWVTGRTPRYFRR